MGFGVSNDYNSALFNICTRSLDNSVYCTGQIFGLILHRSLCSGSEAIPCVPLLIDCTCFCFLLSIPWAYLYRKVSYYRQKRYQRPRIPCICHGITHDVLDYMANNCLYYVQWSCKVCHVYRRPASVKLFSNRSYVAVIVLVPMTYFFFSQTSASSLLNRLLFGALTFCDLLVPAGMIFTFRLVHVRINDHTEIGFLSVPLVCCNKNIMDLVRTYKHVLNFIFLRYQCSWLLCHVKTLGDCKLILGSI
ncbi:hypothetical protein BDR04DRAFT_660652 [Suillus decipiens]|nr:hypothetical protein BDR04DRAFT_660652 [Suillus decipiens]